ncbi:MAG: hypothetical protein II961_05135 [Candidatus Riflebacteria bacterium]|nr:hypothetical protein [Candidatus Riflebacteria bacterium]
MWAKVKKANKDGLPQTALKELEPIYQKAIKEKNQSQAVKALCKMITMEGIVQGNLPEERIIRFEKAVETSDKEIQPLLKVVLAKWYFYYYNRNRYKFLDRTRTSESTDLNDFKTWDLPRLFGHIGKLYDSALENEKELSAIPISKFDGFLVKGDYPIELRNNLYEFLVYEALNFYGHEDQSTIKPQIAFEIDADSKAFDSIDEFINWKPETLDSDSCNFKALKLYQSLLSLNKANKNENALIYNNIERLCWAYRVAVGADKTDRLISALKKLSHEYPNNPHVARAIYIIAEEHKKNEDYVKAIDYAENAYQKWPESYGGKRAFNLIQAIKRPSIEYRSEKVISTNTNKFKVSFSNLTHAYFRLIKRDDDEILNSERDGYYNNSDVKSLLSLQPDYSFDTELNPESDYKIHTKLVDIPKIKKGYYWLIGSANKEFDINNNSISIDAIIVSDLAVVSKSKDVDGKNKAFILDSITGKPIENADVKIYNFDYRIDKYELFTTVKTDKNGIAEYQGTNRSLLLSCNYKDDKIYSPLPLNGNFLRSYPNSRIYIFTDRAIYRPGQTVYFKAISIYRNEDCTDYRVNRNEELEIRLLDPNRQIVNKLNLKTNEFGSVKGSFVIPTDRLTGQYTIGCSHQQRRIRVEEYKRPKFKVTLDKPKESYKLDQKVNLKGHALSYAGANIDNAEVNYRVVRKVIFPYWCWWIRPIEKSQEIAHATVKTNENGEFEVSFVAKPDRTIEESSNPIFTYTVIADVTDNTGETRSAKQTVRIGYTAIELTIDSPNRFNADKEYEFSINSNTHDGEKVSADGKIRIYALKQPDQPERYSYSISDITDDNTAIRNMKEGKVVFEERFSTGSEGTYKKSIKLPEGIYRIKAESEDRYGKEVKVEKDLIALSYTSKNMTVKLPYIFEITSKNLKPGDNFEAFWATGYNQGPAYIEICHRNIPLISYWTGNDKNKHFISFPITEEMRGGFFVKVFQVKENKYYGEEKYINVNWSNKDLNLKLVHFTSKMEPGSKESWKIEISGEDAEAKSIEMLAAMYDASLDAFAVNSWEKINVFYTDRNEILSRFSNYPIRLRNWRDNFKSKYQSVDSPRFPEFPNDIVTDYYGYGYPQTKGVMIKAARAPSIEPMRNYNTAVAVDSKSATQELTANSFVAAPKRISRPPSKDSAKEDSSSSSGSSSNNTPEINLTNVKARTNLNETAFFMPQLILNDKGIVTIDFDMPEALTTWKFMGFAHGKELQSGILTQEVITQKELMIQPNAPRFLREGDKIAFTVKVTNLSDKEQKGSVALELFDAVTDESRNAEFKNNENKKSFVIPAKQSRGFSWLLDVPYKPGFVKYKAVGATNTNSDGEEGLLPILSSRILVTESLPLPIRGPETKNFKFEKLIKSSGSKTLEHKALTVEVTSNPTWYAIQALPYLIEYPFECSEQLFNRIYANKLAAHIANSDPKIRRVFDIWRKDELYNKGTALMSNLEKNQHLKSVTLMETPWVLDAKNENEQKHHIGVLFEDSRLKREIEEATRKLKERQLSNGAFPWFPGGNPSTFITNYIMTGYGRLRNLGVEIDLLIALKCADYVDNEINRIYNEIIKYDPDYEKNNHVNSFIAFYLYGRSFFLKDRPIPSYCRAAVDYFIKQAKMFWLQVPYRMSQAHLALGLKRFGDNEIPNKIVKSIKERSVTNEEMGRFWREKEIGYSWNRADIETQAMMIEMFSEITNDEEAVEECKIWLLKQKQTQCWKSTKATADAVYSLILRGCDLLASDKLVTIYLDNKEVKQEKVEAGTGYYQKIYSGAEVKPQMGNIQLKKEDKGVAWGAVHWQYIEDMSKVTPFENNLKLKKTLFVKKNTVKGPEISPVKDGKLRVGDLVVVRIELRTDRDLEFVHMKDQRGSGMEPVNVLSRFKWQDGLGYYESTKDTASHFFIDYLPKGTYVFEYEIRVQLAGQYQTGIAEIMCMYAPEFNSHSESFMLNVVSQE